MRSTRTKKQFTSKELLQEKRQALQDIRDKLQKQRQLLAATQAAQEKHKEKIANIPSRLLHLEAELARTQPEADELQAIVEYLELRSSNWLLQHPFLPGTGSFQQRIQILTEQGMQVDIPQEFLCCITQNTIMDSPMLMSGMTKGEFTYIDESSYNALELVEVNELGRKRSKGEHAGFNGRKFRCNPFNNLAFIKGKPEIDMEFREQIETFVVIHELQAHLQQVEEMRLQEIQKRHERAAATGIKLPDLHQHTDDMIADKSIPLCKKKLPRYFRSNLFDNSYMSFPIRIDQQWSIDFHDLIKAQTIIHRDQTSKKPVTPKQQEQLEQTKAKRRNFHESNISRHRTLTKMALQSIHNNNTSRHLVFEGFHEFLPSDKAARGEEINRLSNLDINELIIELKARHNQRLLKQEELYKQAISEIDALTYSDICDHDTITHYNPFIKGELKPIKTLLICSDVLLELDKVTEEALHASIPGFQERCTKLFAERNKLLEKQKSLRDKLKCSPIILARIQDDEDHIHKMISELEKVKSNLEMELRIEETRQFADHAEKKIKIEPELISWHNHTFMEILVSHDYPVAMLPAVLQCNSGTQHNVTLLTHPILLDRKHLIELEELEQFWNPPARIFGLWQPARQTGINPCTRKPVQTIEYASELREMAVSFLKHIDEFKEIIAEYNQTDIKAIHSNLTMDDNQDQDALQERLCKLLEKTTLEDRVKRCLFATMMNATIEPGRLHSSSAISHKY